MLVTTTPIVEGYPVTQYLRVVCGETIAGAQAVLDQIQQALDLIPAFDTERTQGLARSLSESAESAVLHPELVMLGAW